MLSRVMGLARDVVFARVIGAEAFADVFFVAFKIPNFFRRLFAEGAFAQAFVPILGEYREQGSQAAVRSLISRVSGTLGLTLLLFTLVIVLAAPAMAAIFAPKWFFNDPLKFTATAEMLRITFPYLMFISMTGVAGGILNSYDRFAVPAFTPILLNISLIAAALIAAPMFEQPAFALAWGVLFAGILQFIFQIPFLLRIHMLPAPKVDWHHPGVRKILKLMGPAIFGVSVSQINLLLDTMLATFLPTGSVSWLYYSDRLSELPLGVFGVAIATVILPNLSRHHAASSTQEYSETLDWALKMILLIAVPASAALVLLAEPILVTLFYYGDVMTIRDMSMATLSLRAYALGLIAFMLIKVLAPGFFARQDMRTPVRIGIIAMVTNMVLNILFVVPLHFYWQIGHLGLAAATSVAAFLNAILLYIYLKRSGVYVASGHWVGFFCRLSAAVGAMLVVLVLVAGPLDALNSEVWQNMPWWQRSRGILGLCAAGFVAYVLMLLITGFKMSDLRGPAKATSRQS
ncbi:MAG: murein biosynthesis integral membrane protein MurJ [Porticoccaceae bacterium]|nr:murein biosynthesis integral membrane protein MurJ [Porticoccaceae bacterium]MBT3798575.1 murein biosynthesis integral membrane protein MurJ [Porticoccaceae bacterium]MBT4164111.1 murein biosynthesis integral membrane protein MurJ [Porticoccaceae bacterium]MBT4591501.1 murein biosynthesis integral membrane protein MurJ [Porticoccaceae bacterium]MBT5004610.1 murein biosynthesis integral membrane protein MurJ [Porticoccaceae bacterium]